MAQLNINQNVSTVLTAQLTNVANDSSIHVSRDGTVN